MRRLLATSAVLGLLVAIVAVAPASAKTRTDVTMTVETLFEQEASEFTATVAGCTEGLTYTAGNAAFPPPFGVFIGYKFFACDGSEETGFVVRLNAQFSYSGGSTGTWTVVDAWGDLAGMTGGGKLVGIPIEGENGITDYYVGTVAL
jgi:hypothetical protein